MSDSENIEFDEDLEFNKAKKVIKINKEILVVIENDGSKVSEINSIKKYFTEYFLVVLYSDVEAKMAGAVRGTASVKVSKRYLLATLKKLYDEFNLDSENKRKYLENNRLFDVDNRTLQLYENFLYARHAVAHVDAEKIEVSWEDLNGIDSQGDKVKSDILEVVKRITDLLVERYLPSAL